MKDKKYQEIRKNVLIQIDKLRRLRDDITAQDPVFVNSLPADVRQKMVLLDREASRLRKADLNIAFVGGFSAGKSSLVNAFLGRYLLPESTKITTAVPTFVRSTTEEEIAELHYLSDSEFSELGDMYRNEIATLYALPELETMPFEELVEQVETLSKEGRGRRIFEQFKLYHEHREERDFEPQGKVVTVPLHVAFEKICDETEAMFLDHVVIRIATTDIPHDVVIVDLPGVSVPNPRHRQITFRFVKQDAHAVVFVLMATRLFDKDEMEVMELFRTGDNRIAEKTFWVLNRWDALSSQQQKQTVSDFENKIMEFGLPPSVRCFRTNALHGLLSQLGMKKDFPSDIPLQSHLKDYETSLPIQYDNSHETAFKESQINLLQEQVLSFLNGQLRQTTLNSAIENARSIFADPLSYHLRRAKDSDETLIRDDLTKQQKGCVMQRIDKRFTERQKEVMVQFQDLRNDVAIKRSDILKERTNDLVKQLRTKITNGAETDAYQVYQEIIAGRELRKYPYHFEIEMQVVDSLNTMLKRSFREIVKEQIDEVFQDLTVKAKNALEKVREDVEYSMQVMNHFDTVFHEAKLSFGNRIDGVVMTFAAQLDELLLYNPHSFFSFFPWETGPNMILKGLDEAARMGLENLKKPGQAIVKDDFIDKTAKIRATLTEHYIDKVREYHQNITGNIFPIVINNLQEIEKKIIETMHSKYRPALEIVIEKEIEGEFSEQRKLLEKRTRRFRNLIEQIEKFNKEIGKIISTISVESELTKIEYDSENASV
jgi:GTP-binding protein EngB required for normal cell division